MGQIMACADSTNILTARPYAVKKVRHHDVPQRCEDYGFAAYLLFKGCAWKVRSQPVVFFTHHVIIVLTDPRQLMIVYGDQHEQRVLNELIAELRHRATKTPGENSTALDEARTLLILAGQVEQALFDGVEGVASPYELETYLAQAKVSTDQAAASFYALWSEANYELRITNYELSEAPQIHGPSNMVVVKLPEGFAYYALYPELYISAARHWLSEHEGTGRVLVVGVRSIGTSLSAVVEAVLNADGWQASRITVRPGGHPFAREVEIAQKDIQGADWAIVVDEGPGLSGSSMAAVGLALERAGLSAGRVSAFPGHAGEPGSAATEEVRAWWASTPRYVAAPGSWRYDGLSLEGALSAWLEQKVPEAGKIVSISDMGGGEWRKHIYSSREEWPAVAVQFERPKFKCTCEDGKRFLFKFEGLAVLRGGVTTAEAAFEQMAVRARSGWGPLPLGVMHGYVCLPWVEGVPVGREDVSEPLLRQVGRYIADSAGARPSSDEASSSFGRISDMLYWNAREASGEELSSWTPRDHYRPPTTGVMPRAYTDGHMSPHEWILTTEGRLVKVDSAGHVWDHTVVGRQPIAWDIAGALVEWGLNMEQAAILLDAYLERGGDEIAEPALTFYRMAYCAFKLGQVKMCAEMTGHDPAEQARLWRAYEGYTGELARLIKITRSGGVQ